MTPEQLKEIKEEITTTVRTVVNGKIDKMNEKFDVYIDDDMRWKGTVDEYMKEMSPVKDGLRTIQSLNKFAKWVGLPAVGALVAYFLTK